MGDVLKINAQYDAGKVSDYNSTPPVSNPPDYEIFTAGDRLREWARYLARNSSIVKATLDARVAKGIGDGLQYEPMVKNPRGELLESLNDKIRRIHEDWSKAADVTTELSRQEIERISWREWDTVGEIFHRAVFRGRTPDRVGYQVQQIRSELVPYGFINRGDPIMGVERDAFGAPLRYWVYPTDARSQVWFYRLPTVDPIPVPASQIRHLRRQEEAHQTRGVTLLHAVIFRASDIAEYQQSHRRAARASANLFASITREDGEGSDTNLNLGDLQILDSLDAGESLNFHDPAHPNQNAVDFVNQELRQYAAATRVAFSWIAYVFDRAFAAQRTELIHAWEMILEDRGQFIRDFAHPMLYRRPLETALLEGRISNTALRGVDRRTLFDVRIQGPAMPSIDPVTDRQAAQIDEQMGWESKDGNIRRFGRSPAQVLAERMREKEKAEELGLAVMAEQNQQQQNNQEQPNEQDEETDE